ncbi:MFS transporter [Paenibacillus abyssi]|uniref:MFS transporter n=1 Tax=Paenibacillus abyssi TaxID=1340531 RepID=A0A917CXX3_9BACL|nr:MFS transporter [Paenibacillus abyssi]GGG00931.1 MFS transporter [Paenibacillus abyssi]
MEKEAEIREQRSLKEVWMITIGHGLTHWYPATFYLLLPIIGKELGLTYTQIGFIISCQYIASSISNVPSGMLVDMVGRKSLLLATSLFWVGFPYLLMSFTQNYWFLLVCVALVGIGNNLWHPTAIPTLAQRFPDRKGFVLSIHSVGANVGDALAPLAIGSILAVLDWRQVVAFNVVPGVFIALAILFFLRNLYVVKKDKKEADTGTGKAADTTKAKEGMSFKEYFSGLKSLLKNRNLLIISSSSGFRSMTQNALNTFLPLYLFYELMFSEAMLGVALFVLQLAGLIAAPISGTLSDRLGRKRIIMASMLMTAAVLVVMAAAPNSKFFVVFIAVLGFFLYAIRPVMQAWLMDSTPKKMAGTSIGLLFGVQAMFSALAPTAAGLVADRFGLFSTFYFVAATIVIANFLIFFMPNQTTNKKDAAPSASG